MKLEKAQRHSLKIIAIFFAVSLWFYVLNSEPVEIEKKITIQFIVPKGFAVASLADRELTLKLKGSKAFIGNVFSNKEKLTVDLNPYYKKFGKNFKVLYHPSQIAVPFGVDILEMRPREANIEIDRMVMMELPVHVTYIGNMGYDKKFKEVSVDPQNIMIKGPIDVIKKLSRIDTNPVNLSNIDKEEGTITVPLDEIDPRLSFEENPRVRLKYKVQLTIPKRADIKKE
ncbi:MAG: YbbR-like domain-containing protein [Rhizobacter sp.]|nr:YbbR-like domain-containing protein [Bacteriovorax sp.]